ncbi:MAG: class I SAM-dependent methyltransferase [Gemmatimonadaceae bacterium]
MPDKNAFPDHFSKVASGYSAFRPNYPDSLFKALVEVVGREKSANAFVWDCAAGNGQASLALAEHFKRVFATDASVAQISGAPVHANLTRAAATAEACPLRAGSVDVVTVAQALHWFNFERFYAEVKRVLAPNGVIAVWSYGLVRVDTNARLEAAIDHFSEQTIKDWWPTERRYVNEAYTTLPFPFELIEFPPQHMSASWTQQQLLGYLRTWSSVSKKRAADGVDPVLAFESILAAAWGTAPEITLRWPLAVLVGRTS